VRIAQEFQASLDLPFFVEFQFGQNLLGSSKVCKCGRPWEDVYAESNTRAIRLFRDWV
jgi:hypothetical protein